MKPTHIIATLLLTSTAAYADRTIKHDHELFDLTYDESAYYRLVEKVAVAIESKVKWTEPVDAKADGAVALEAFKKEFSKINPKTAPADKANGKKKFDAEAFQGDVRDTLDLDAYPIEGDADRDSQMAVRDVFDEAFNSGSAEESNDHRTTAGIEEAGPAPEIDGMTGIPGFVRAEDAIKHLVNDPDSVKLDRVIGVPNPFKHNGQSCWEFRVAFRAKNAFGGYVRSAADIYWRNGEVVDAEIIH